MDLLSTKKVPRCLTKQLKHSLLGNPSFLKEILFDSQTISSVSVVIKLSRRENALKQSTRKNWMTSLTEYKNYGPGSRSLCDLWTG